MFGALGSFLSTPGGAVFWLAAEVLLWAAVMVAILWPRRTRGE